MNNASEQTKVDHDKALVLAISTMDVPDDRLAAHDSLLGTPNGPTMAAILLERATGWPTAPRLGYSPGLNLELLAVIGSN